MQKKIIKKITSLYFSTILLISLITVFPSVVTDSAGWGEDTRLTYDDSTSRLPSLAVNGDNIHVTWQDNRSGNYEIYYKRSIDNGDTWSSDTRLTYDDSGSYEPSLAVNGDNIHVTWEDGRNGNGDIYYKRSIDNGETWSSDIRLTIDDSTSWLPSLAVNGDNIHVTWQDHRDIRSEIYYKRSIDNGDTWDSDTRLTYDDESSYHPSLAVNGNNIHVTWYDYRDDNYEIYYKRSIDNGDSWSSDTRLTIDDSVSWGPSLAVNGNNIHVSWIDRRDDNQEIYYKNSIDNGDSWSSDTRLTYDDSNSYHPSLAVNGNNIHVTWEDWRDDNYEIYYKRSIDNGDSWSSDTRLTYEDSISEESSLAISGENIHVTWIDNRDGNDEIYYKHKINLPPFEPSNPDPKDNEIDVIPVPDRRLSWAGGDPDGDSVTYDIYIGTINPPPKIISKQINNFFNTGITNNYDTTYFWKVVAWDEHGDNTSGPVWSFTTEKDEFPPSIEITKPIKALYLLNFQIRQFIFRKPLIIGDIDINVDVSDDKSGTDYVEFYIDDDQYSVINSEPFSYRWEREFSFRHKHKITVVAYDNVGNNASVEIKVWRFL